jgi:hypothetical protein
MPNYTADDIIPPQDWGKDHWSTLAYLETVMVDCGGFQVGRDPRMRANRRNFRVMAEMCPNPQRAGLNTASRAVAMDRSNGSRLRDGSVVDNHDDWCCVQDMAEAGLFRTGVEGVEPKRVLKLSALGLKVCAELRAWKAGGGQLKDFVSKQIAAVNEIQPV